MPFVFPHRQQIASMLESMIPSVKADHVTDVQLLTLRKQMIEASRIYPFKNDFERNFEKVFGCQAPGNQMLFWNLYNKVREYSFEQYLSMVVPHLAMDPKIIAEFVIKSKIAEDIVIQSMIELHQAYLNASASPSKYVVPSNALFAPALSRALFHLPLRGYAPLRKNLRNTIGDLRKKYPDKSSFLKAASQYYTSSQSQRKKSPFLLVLNPLSKIDPLLFCDYELTSKNINDISLECSIYLKTIAATVDPNERREQVTIVLPSFQLIYHWCNDPILSTVKAVFVMEDSTICRILRTSNYVKGKPIVFHDYEDTQRTRWLSSKLPPASVFAIALPSISANGLTITSAIQPFVSKKLLSDNCRIVGFFGRSSDVPETAPSPQHNDLLQQLSLRSVVFLPRGIALSTQPATKILFQAVFHTSVQDNPRVQVESYAKYTQTKRAFLRPEYHKSFSTVLGFNLLGNTYQQIYSMKRVLSGDVSKRQFPQQYRKFGPNISIWFTLRNLSKGRLQYVLYVCSPSFGSTDVPDIKNRGPIIKSTQRQLLYDPAISIDTFFRQYLFSHVVVSGKKTAIRVLVAAERESFYSSPSLTLREFWFLHPEFDLEMDAGLSEAMVDFMLSRHADQPIRSLTADDVEASIEEHFDRKSLDFRAVFTDYIGDLFALAKSETYIEKDILEEINDKGHKRRRNTPKEIRDVLKNSSLTIGQLTSLKKLLVNHKDNAYYIGAAIQMTTGVEIREVCALRWKAYEYDDSKKQHLLRIDAQVTMDGKPTKMLRSERIRTLPCEIGEILQERYAQLRQSIPKDRLDKLYIVTDKVDCSVATPRDYKSFVQELLEQYVPDLQVLIPHGTTKVKSINLSGDDIDFFRRSFEHHAKRTMMLTNGESSYALGIAPKYTMDINYIDHEHPLSRHMVHVKSRRLTALLEDVDNTTIPRVRSFLGNTIMLSSTSTSAQAQRNVVQVSLPAGKSLKAVFYSQHGMHINAAVYQQPAHEEDNINDDPKAESM